MTHPEPNRPEANPSEANPSDANPKAPVFHLRDVPSIATREPDLLRALPDVHLGPEESEKEESDIGGDVFRSILPGNPGVEQDPWSDEEEDEEDEES